MLKASLQLGIHVLNTLKQVWKGGNGGLFSLKENFFVIFVTRLLIIYPLLLMQPQIWCDENDKVWRKWHLDFVPR